MSIAERIASMSNNLSDAYDGIEYLGVDTTGVDKNLQNLSSMLNVVYEGLPKVSDEGVSPSIEGSRVGRLKSTLKASDTTQFSTTGANKFSFNTNKRRVVSGVNIPTVQQDNSVVFNTTGTGVWTNISYTYENTSKNTDYYLKLIAKSSINISSRVTVYGTDVLNYANTDLTNIIAVDLSLTANTFADGSLTFNSGNYDYLVFRFWGNASSTTLSEIATMTFDNVMLSLTDTTYEPYTGCIPSPNPDFPQSIHVVKGNNTVFVGGKSLYDASMEETTTRGITRSADKERLYLNGTVASQGNVEFPINDTILPAGKYRLNLEIESGTVPDENGFNFYLYATTITGNTAKSAVIRLKPAPTQKGITLELNEPARLYIHGYNQVVGFTITNIVLKYQVTLGETADYDFVPYTPITTYLLNLPVQNLFDKDNANILDGVYVGTSSLGISSGAKTLYISCLPNTTYTISKISSQRFIVAETDTTPARSVEISNRIANQTGTSITITTSASAKYLVVFYYLSSADTLTEQQILDTIQIEPGDKANRYTPHGVAPIELCKKGDYQDKLFKAVVGDTIYDSLTAEQKEGLVSGGWYRYGEMQKVVLDGVNKKFTQKSGSTANIIWMTPTEYDISTYNPNIMCNYFIKVTSDAAYKNDKLAVYIENQRIKCGFGINTSLTTLALANEWLTTHNLIVYLPYPTPVIEQITDETLINQLEALYSAMSYNGQTNILQTNADLPFIISASALKGA